MWSFFNRDKTKDKEHKKCGVGIAFGGGGTKGFAHIGVLKALEENNLVDRFDKVAGTSAGSIIAVAFSYGLTSKELTKIAKNINEKDIRKSKMFIMPSKTEGLQDLIRNSLGDIEFSDLKLPTSIVAVDITNGKEMELTEGNVAKSVAASCAVPGVFNYVQIDKMHLVDGGLKNNLPCDVLLRNGCEKVLAVDLGSKNLKGTQSGRVLDVLTASLGIVLRANSERGRLLANVLIEPDMGAYKSSKLYDIDEMIEQGYKAAMEKMDDIKRLLGIKVKKPKEFSFKRKNKKPKEEVKKEKQEKPKDKKVKVKETEMTEMIENIAFDIVKEKEDK